MNIEKLSKIMASGLNRKSVTPELQAKIDSAREHRRKGNFVSCSTADDLRHYLISL